MSTQQPPRPKRRRVDSTCVKETTQAKQPHPPAASTSSAPASTNQQQLFSSTKTDVVTSTPSRQYTCNRDVDYSRMALLLHAAIQPTPTASPTTPTYPYGNYHAYYGYRLASAFEEDARLKVGEANVAYGDHSRHASRCDHQHHPHIIDLGTASQLVCTQRRARRRMQRGPCHHCIGSQIWLQKHPGH